MNRRKRPLEREREFKRGGLGKRAHFRPLFLPCPELRFTMWLE